MKKIDKKVIICAMICIMLCGGLCVVDLFVDIEYKPLINVFDLLFSSITVIVGVWITCYLLFLELYKDRYPFNILNNENTPDMQLNFFLLFFSVVFGCVVVLLGYPFYGTIGFCAISLITIVVVFINIYNTKETFTLNTYVEEFFERISKDFNDNKIEVFEKSLKDIWGIFDENVIKEEYFVARNIAKKTGEAFRAFLANSIKIAQASNKGDVEDSFDRIVDFNIDQLELCKDMSSDMLISTIISEQKKNLKFCITYDQYEWYKKYIKKYNALVYKMQKEENGNLTEALYNVYYSLLYELIEKNKKEWIEYSVGEMETFTMAYMFAYNRTNIRNYIVFLSQMAIHCLEEKVLELYDVFWIRISKITKIRGAENGYFNEFVMYYAYLFRHLIDNDIEKTFEFLKMTMEQRVRSSGDSDLIDFRIFCIKELNKKVSTDKEKQALLYKYYIDTLIEVIELKSERYYELPDFYGRLIEHEHSEDKFEETVIDIRKLLNYSVINDNSSTFYYVLREIKLMLLKTEQRQKKMQEALLEIYFWLFGRLISLTNQQFYETTLDEFRDIVDELDKKGSISEDLGCYLINKIAGCVHERDRDMDNQKLIVCAIESLFSFLAEGKEYRFLASKVKIKKLLVRNLFNIGTSCVENNFEEGVRKVSNAIGWLTIYSIRQGTVELTSYLIERANELFYILNKMEVSRNTRIFMLTLFTTVGTYCFKEPQYIVFANKLIDGIKNEKSEDIRVAIRLRTSENDMWKDLYDNKTKVLSDKFINAFEKAKK